MHTSTHHHIHVDTPALTVDIGMTTGVDTDSVTVDMVLEQVTAILRSHGIVKTGPKAQRAENHVHHSIVHTQSWKV